ncbi:hypothetical protein [Mucilaginibacter gotjawali]|uniref:Uncharacterized protein n=2 Tax=Mucilaginibacter gotjawali TaxID=1550579 RepID=A0A839SLY5_9SPHI|nr:hypothetical protein [Mucilaginibacter gotjawali]MBB3058343.1 hypothetical protein [Mucilaginibacter gotjawali]BAU55537.1 hypothetical protein MgSA37_03726 [Mucilaginibacter gotjawali]
MNVKKVLITTAFIIALSTSYGFKYRFDEQDWLSYTNRCLAQSYDASGDSKLKKVEFFLTPDSFIRLRKTYAKGKQEYYSFNLHQLNDFDYLGSSTTGILEFKTLADDIIVQTYNDRHGDVDSMTTVLDIPVKNMEPERLDSLHEALNYFKAKRL